MVSAPLPTRSTFLAQITNQRGVRFVPRETGDDKQQGWTSEQIVRLHDDHVINYQESAQYFKYRNTCPLCHEILFQEGISGDDNTNLKRILNLQLQQNRCSENGNHQMKATFYNIWRRLADDRASAFTKIQLHIDLEDYTIFRGRAEHPPYRLPWRPRKLDAEVLVRELEEFWDHLYMESTQPITREIVRPSSLTIPCHPISGLLRLHMIATLRRLDGRVIPARHLKDELSKDFTNAFLFQRSLLKQAPQGFLIFQALLCDAVLVWFIELKPERDPESALDRQLSRFPGLKLSEVEEPEGIAIPVRQVL